MCSLWQPVAPDIALFMLALNVRFWPNTDMAVTDPNRTLTTLSILFNTSLLGRQSFLYQHVNQSFHAVHVGQDNTFQMDPSECYPCAFLITEYVCQKIEPLIG